MITGITMTTNPNVTTAKPVLAQAVDRLEDGNKTLAMLLSRLVVIKNRLSEPPPVPPESSVSEMKMLPSNGVVERIHSEIDDFANLRADIDDAIERIETLIG